MEILLKEKSSWASYDLTHFPNVKVVLGQKINNDEEFQKFLDDWEELYKRGQDFTLNFNASNVGYVSMKYCFKMRNFIRKIKKEYPRHLKESYIRIDSKWVKFLLKFIFFLEKPVAPVRVYSGSLEEDSQITTYNP